MKFGTILIDPPWNYRTSKNGAAEKHYKTLSDTDLMGLPVKSLARKDAVVLLWATMPKLDIAYRCLESWGAEHVTAFPWFKMKDHPALDLYGNLQATPNWGIGYWVRGMAELVIVARFGKPQRPQGDHLGLISKVMKHSKKPAHIYEYAELCPGPRVEIFARPPDKRNRGAQFANPDPAWWYLGNEVNAGLDIREAIPLAIESENKDEFQAAIEHRFIQSCFGLTATVTP